MFLTSVGLAGNLGGIAGADERCQEEAESASLQGSFLAWISNSAASPAERFSRIGDPWALPNGQEVAVDWDDLTDGSLMHAIDQTAEGETIPDAGVWTNTASDGTALGLSCNDWLSDANEGIFGDAKSSKTFEWTAFGKPSPVFCSNEFRLYCFEQ